MRFYLVTALVTVLLLVSMLSYKQAIFTPSALPYDDEQTGLNEQITIHFSHVVAENTPKGLAALKFAQLVEEKSNGQITVQIYPNGILYNDSNEMEALRNGDVQMIAPTLSKVTTLLPSWQVLDLPFLIETDAQLYAILHSDLSKSLLAELDSLDIKGMTFWNNGFKQMVAKNQPLVNVEDFNNLPIRTMDSHILKKQFSLLEATPVVTTFNELYNELQTEGVLAQENTISNIFSKSYYNLHSNITLSNHGILSYAVMMNEDFWQTLDAEKQTIILDSFEEMRHWQHEQAALINAQNLQALQENNAVNIFHLTNEQRAEWKTKVEPIYQYYTDQIDSRYLHILLDELKRVK